MITIEKLNSFGVDTAEGLERCFGNEALYLKLVTTIPDDATFERLEKKVASKDLDGAFEAAHALKGVLGNLSLTPLYTLAVEITFSGTFRSRRYIRLLSRLPNSCAIARKWITAHFWSNFSKNEMSSASFVLNKNSQ